MKRLTKPFTLAVFLLLLIPSITTAQGEKSILSILSADGRFTTLLAAIEYTETEQAFSEGHWTLFAPTDEAFAALGLNAENISALGLQETADLLLYQAMTRAITADNAKTMLGDVTMANGWPAGLKWYAGSLWVNDEARVTEKDILASNGVIHVVNRVITPPWPRAEEGNEPAFLTALAAAQDALAAGGSAVAVEPALFETSPAATTSMDEPADTTQGSDAVSEATPESAGDAEEMPAVEIPPNSVLGVMAADGRFTTYLAAVGALDLVVPFIEGEWTVFAPTDEAFAEYGLDANNIAQEISVGELADLLLYHTLDEKIKVDKAKTMLGDITMRNGQLAGLKYFAGSLWVNDNAQVISPDIMADNGVIHALNAVIQRPWPYPATEEALPAAGDSSAGIPNLE